MTYQQTKINLNDITGTEMLCLSLYHYSFVSIPLIAHLLRLDKETVERTVHRKAIYANYLDHSFIKHTHDFYFDEFVPTKSKCLLVRADGTFINYRFVYGRDSWRICRPKKGIVQYHRNGKPTNSNAFRLSYEAHYGFNPRVSKYVPIDGDLENLKLENILAYTPLSKEEFGQIYSHIHSVDVSEEEAHRIYDPILGYKRVDQILNPRSFPTNETLSLEILDHVKRGKKLKDLLSIYKYEDPDLIRYEYRRVM